MQFSWDLLREAAGQWSKHNAPRLGAALAYYTILSLAPLLIVVVAVCGFAFNQEQIYGQIREVAGDQSAAVVQSLLKSAHRPAEGILASALGFVVLLAGASGVFGELRDTLNFIWDAPIPAPAGLGTMIRYRVFSFAMVLCLGFLLMVSLAVTAAVQGIGALASHYIPAGATLFEAFNFLATLLVTTVLFALIYRFIPQVPIDWGDVTAGAAVTALLFAAGKFLIGLYVGKAAIGSAYGAASSMIVFLVWVYYSAQIFLFGAEFTHVYALHRGSPAIGSAISKVGLPPGTTPPPPS